MIYQFPPLTISPDFNPLLIDGSSTGSILTEDPFFDCGSEKVCSFDHSSFVCKEADCRNYLCRQAMDFISDSSELVEEKEVSMKPQTDRFRSKNLITERKRRDRLKDRLYTLRGLVPKITKMDRLSTLVDSITFIKELQKKVNELEDELKNIEESTKKTEDEPIKEESSNENALLETETEVEVKQINEKEFFVKFFCKQKKGGFTKMMEAMSSLGLCVMDANVTTFKGMVLNILKVEAETKAVEAQKVNELLLNLTSSDGCSSE